MGAFKNIFIDEADLHHDHECYVAHMNREEPNFNGGCRPMSFLVPRMAQITTRNKSLKIIQ
jgi:hypothetical protein